MVILPAESFRRFGFAERKVLADFERRSGGRLCEAEGFGDLAASQLRIARRFAGERVSGDSAAGWRCERKRRQTF